MRTFRTPDHRCRTPPVLLSLGEVQYCSFNVMLFCCYNELMSKVSISSTIRIKEYEMNKGNKRPKGDCPWQADAAA